MAQEVYFNYGSRISSKRLGEAIAVPTGIGPFCGFGSAEINSTNNEIILKPGPIGSASGIQTNTQLEYTKSAGIDRLTSRKISTSSDANEDSFIINFGCITPDGTIFRSGEAEITLGIQGTKGSLNEVLVFAKHKHISEPVENLVDFVAYWNNSGESFFNFYKSFEDIYYPLSIDERRAKVSNDPVLQDKFSYDKLFSMATSAVRDFGNNIKEWCLIGVYGTGNNQIADGRAQEYFSLVPYSGRVQEINYNTAIHSYFKESLRRAENYLAYEYLEEEEKKYGQSFSNIVEYVEFLINQRVTSLENKIEEAILPVGSIILTDSAVTPKGWEPYTKAQGRVVVGFIEGGVEIDTYNEGKTRILSSLGEIWDPAVSDQKYTIRITRSDLPKHIHGIGLKGGRQENSSDVYSCCVVNYAERSTGIQGSFPDSKYNPINNVREGGVVSGINTTSLDDPNAEGNREDIRIAKLPPAVTLRYIRKVQS